VYGAIAFRLAQGSPDPDFIWTLALLALVSGLLQCSYWVFYYVSYTRQVGSYAQNHTNESITEEDRQAVASGEVSGAVYFLQSRLAGRTDRRTGPHQPQDGGLP